ncbi:uncharacterized protein LOC135384296 [Ornithodoros turicata]|uniref:uncharacterized protein LOC135384296 n=1 Tax=Ornithodoros turicata TaxID=34597 RepID=UPI003138F56B
MRKRTPRWKTNNQDNIEKFANKLEEALATSMPPNYEAFIQKLEESARTTVGKTSSGASKGKARPWCDKEVLDSIRERKRLCREWRRARKSKTDCEAEKEVYEKQQEKTKRLVAGKLDQYYRGIEIDIMNGGRKNGQKFWRYIEDMNNQRQPTKPEIVLYGNIKGRKINKKEEQEQYMTQYFQQQQEDMQKRISPQHDQAAHPAHQPSDARVEEISEAELARHLNKLMRGKATGPDEIPNEFLKALEPLSKEALRRMLNFILQTKQVPKSWKHSTVWLLYKGQGKPRNDLKSFRPIT